MAIVDDHLPTIKRFSEFFQTTLNANVIYRAENGYAFMKQFNPHKLLPQIMLVDINMPVIDGIALTNFMKVHHPGIKIICCSVYETEEMVKTAFLAGADAYILKAVAEKSLQHAVNKIIDNNFFIDPHTAITEQSVKPFMLKHKKRAGTEDVFGLTQREKTFVMLAATMLNYEQIAELMFIDIKTIHSYFNQVKKKLNTPSRQALLIFSLQNGLAIHANYHLAA